MKKRKGSKLHPRGTPQTSAATAYSTIKHRILNSAYSPGATVTVQSLAVELKISRTPLREALVRLKEERLVELIPRQGFRILPLSPSDMLEIYQLLAGLECVAIELLTYRGLNKTEKKRLLSTIESQEAALRADDLTKWATADFSFHQILIELAGSNYLTAAVGHYIDQTSRARTLTLRLRPKPVKSTSNHRKLVEAILARDSKAAREIHWDQRFRSGKELSEILVDLNVRQL
jgi:DNA-binding GntR family transcriptional regulator